MYNLLGFAVAIFFVKTALGILGVGSDFYLDEVAGLVVFGGTLSALVISFPPRFILRLLRAPLNILRSKKLNYIHNIETIVKAVDQRQNLRALLKKAVKDKKVDAFLKEGIELYLLDLSKSDFKNIMTERIYRARQRDEDDVDLFRRLAKYPPAFGLVGTVLGLISLMRSVGAGANVAEIGLNMALALIATLYGLAFANFILLLWLSTFNKWLMRKKFFENFYWKAF